jgi:transketolase
VRSLWDASAAGAAPKPTGPSSFAAYRRPSRPKPPSSNAACAATCRPTSPRSPAGRAAGFGDKPEAVASRKSSQKVLAALAPQLPEMLGGSADLTGSNLTDFPGCGARHISYGVREFGMAAIMNGVALHGGYIPYGGTFLTFSDYSRNAVRMAALMKRA